MKVELNDEEREKIVKEVTKMIYLYMHENITIREVISQEIKRYFDNERAREKEENEKKKT